MVWKISVYAITETCVRRPEIASGFIVECGLSGINVGANQKAWHERSRRILLGGSHILHATRDPLERLNALASESLCITRRQFIDVSKS